MFNMRDLCGYGQYGPQPNWPNGARIAILFVINYEEGGENTPSNSNPATEVFLNKNPSKAMFEQGHEIASHNYWWIDYAALSEEQEREHIHLGINAIKDAIGKPPVSWYRGRILPCSRQIAIEEFKKLGLPLLYDSDAHNDELPYYVGTTW
ncbi:hypothetical protein HDU80_006897 [Chytriomyces hyalinus]|nr:hypothetical protein HDU80_006897 [Chytriomyces hyalinus]